MVAAAMIGGAVIGGVASNRSAKQSSKAVSEGAETSAQAQLEATRLQVDEIARQFDFQQQILMPQIQQQYAAQRAYSDLLGIGGGAGTPAGMGFASPEMATDRFGNQRAGPGVQTYEEEQRQRAREKAILRDYAMRSDDPVVRGQYEQEIARLDARPFREDTFRNAPMTGANDPRAPRFPGAGATQFQRGERGEFVDRNLDPTRLAEAEELTGQVERNRLASADPDADIYRSYIDENRIAAPTLEEDLRFARARDVTLTGARADARMAGDVLTEDDLYTNVLGRSLTEGAAGTGVYGEEFEASPGYAFQVEEMNRALDRRNSAGGNFGGRAIMEAQRRAQGLAAGDYYNWAQGRERDLMRRGQAEATDAGRLDTAATNYMTRRSQDVLRGDQFAQYDIGRGDVAVDAYEQQRTADVARGDAAMENYLGRRTQDVARMDAAVGERDRLRGVDLQRRDQGYYNFLQNLSRQAGFGDTASQAVQASQTAGGQTAAAYGQQGSQLSGIYNALGVNQARITQDRYANINNAFQSGIQNWMTYQMSQPPQNTGQPVQGNASGIRYTDYSTAA